MQAKQAKGQERKGN